MPRRPAEARKRPEDLAQEFELRRSAATHSGSAGTSNTELNAVIAELRNITDALLELLKAQRSERVRRRY